MSRRVGIIARAESIVLLVLSISMIPSLLIAFFNNETRSMHGFLIIILLCSSIGIITRLHFRLSRYNLKNRDGFLIVSLTAFIAIFVGALPFWISGATPNFVDALFETCSGFTTTGASVITNLEVVPKSIIFWRSLTQWLGGFGILVFLTAIAPAFAMDNQSIGDAESTAPIRNKLTSHFSAYSMQIYIIYVSLTFIEVILLKIAGLSIFDAFVHTFSTVSTGGFSAYNDNIGHFDNIFVNIITLIFMFIAALNINLYFLAKKRGITEVFKDEEVHFYCIVMIVIGAIIAVYNVFMNSFKNIAGTVFDAFYQVVSIVTTTGFLTDDYNLWPTFSKFLIFALFFVGGCSSSTAGGIKCLRIVGGFKLIVRGIYSRLHPHIISPVTLNHTEMSNETAIRISNYIFTYVALIVLGTLFLSFNNLDFMSSFSASLSCMGNIGPGFNEVAPYMTYAALNDFSKMICSFLMVTGRLEIYAVLVLFSRNYWNPNKLR